MEHNNNGQADPLPLKSLVIVFSYHHGNTGKIANAVAGVLGAPVKTPKQVRPEEIREYDLVGFGSGIYGGKHHGSLLDLAGRLPRATGTRAFIFSTCGIPEALSGKDYIRNYALTSHAELRQILQEKGYPVIDEFICAGFNTNSFLRFFGGVNKGRPDAGDLRNAEEFARALVEKARRTGVRTAGV
jgi:flavodoxin